MSSKIQILGRNFLYAFFALSLFGSTGCFKKQTKRPAKKVVVISQRDRELAESHYKAGLNYYLNQDLEKAIDEWNKALKLNPHHRKAKEGIKESRATLQKLKRVH